MACWETDPTSGGLFSAWIGSIQYALVFIPGVVTGRLVDLGYFRIPFSVGTAFVVIATFLIAQCTKYWQFLLCQGIFLGVSLSLAPFLKLIPIVLHCSLARGSALEQRSLWSGIGSLNGEGWRWALRRWEAAVVEQYTLSLQGNL